MPNPEVGDSLEEAEGHAGHFQGVEVPFSGRNRKSTGLCRINSKSQPLQSGLEKRENPQRKGVKGSLVKVE